MKAFTLIVGFATIVSLVLQLSGFFEEAPQFLWYATFFLGGVTVGLLINVVSRVNFSMPGDLQAKQFVGLVLYLGTGALVFILFLLGAVLTNETQRSDAIKLGSAVSGFLIFSLWVFFYDFFGGTATSKTAEDEVENSKHVEEETKDG